MVAILHTWGQTLVEHAHLHCLVPAGGWSVKTGRWKCAPKKFFLPVKALSRLFRGKFLACLKDAFQQDRIRFPATLASLNSKTAFNQFLGRFYHTDWVVFTNATFKNATQIVNYLGRYTHRVAISNSRILEVTLDKVTFSWKNYKSNGKAQKLTLDCREFIRRFLLHVLPQGYCRIRYFGILSNRRKLETRTRIDLEPFQRFTSTISGITGYIELLSLLKGVNLLRCPVCLHLTMKLITPENPALHPT